jgi:DNA-binding CsgD family transcriptional regulator
MEVHSFAASRAAPDPLRAQIGRLIEVVGTPRFESQIFQAAYSSINCKHMTAYAVSKDGPRLLMAANTGSTPIARSIADKYLAHYWRLDPVNTAGDLCDKTTNVGIRIAPDEDIDDVTYRQECYTSVQMMDRFTLMQRCGSEVYRIHFLTGGRYGRFAPSDLDHIMNSADLLTSLIIKHDAAGATSQDKLAPQMFLARLRLVEPGMPDREAQVCTAIMLGMTSEAIALKLGISVNTVLTYRKRAYGRLNISCQNELMRLILS